MKHKTISFQFILVLLVMCSCSLASYAAFPMSEHKCAAHEREDLVANGNISEALNDRAIMQTAGFKKKLEDIRQMCKSTLSFRSVREKIAQRRRDLSKCSSDDSGTDLLTWVGILALVAIVLIYYSSTL